MSDTPNGTHLTSRFISVSRVVGVVGQNMNRLDLPMDRDWTSDEWQADQAIADAMVLPRPDAQIDCLAAILKRGLARPETPASSPSTQEPE